MLLCRTTGNHRKPTVTLLEGLPPMPLGKPRSREGPGMSDARFLSMNRPVRIDGKPVEARRLTGEMVPMDAADVGEGKLAFTLRVPVGVVGAISPFNFPLNLVAHKVAPAIAAGCPIVLKPAGQTPLSAIALADLLLDDCGLPPEWLHVVTGSGGDVGDAIVTHDAIAYISFTGSAEVGWRIAAKAPRKE